MKKIAIIGGHGKVAMELSRLLCADGCEVSAIIRKPEQNDEVAATGAHPVVLDVEQAGTDDIAKAFEGHDAVVWSAGAGGGSPERTYAVDRDAAIRSIDAAVRAGVRRYVMVSYLGAGQDHGVPQDNDFFPYAEAKALADAYLRGTELEWTILGPGSLTDHPATGCIDVNPHDDPGPDGGDGNGKNTSTSRGNVARVAAAVLNHPATTARRTIEFRDGATALPAAFRGPG